MKKQQRQTVQNKRKQELLTTVAGNKLAETKRSNDQIAETETDEDSDVSPCTNEISQPETEKSPQDSYAFMSNLPHADPNMYTAQNARYIACCVE